MSSIPAPQARGTARDALDGFISACLAPVTASEEPAAAASYLREIAQDREDAWRLQYLRTLRARYLYSAADVARQLADLEGAKAPSVEGAKAAYEVELHRQMCLPAPSVGALRWKEERRAWGGRSGRPEWEAAMAADIERLAPLLAKIASRKPRRPKIA